jgi:hypothetical protein
LYLRTEVIKRKERIAQEFGFYVSDDMLLTDFMYLSDKVLDIWEKKRKCAEEGTIYIGG